MPVFWIERDTNYFMSTTVNFTQVFFKICPATHEKCQNDVLDAIYRWTSPLGDV